MSWGDYRRVLEGARIPVGRRVAAHAVGAAQVLLIPAMLIVGGLIAALIVSDPAEEVVALRGVGGASLATLSLRTADGAGAGPALGDEDGTDAILLPLYDAREAAARGMLAVLLSVWLGLLLGFVLLELLRRRLACRVAAETTAAIRRQVHRQMYRFGLSALPNEGIGPVVDLFTREIDEVRDGVRAGLDGRVRWPVLIGGLLVLAVVLSPLLALFLVVLGVLVAILVPSLMRRDKSWAGAALRASTMRMSLLQEDLGQVRTVRVFGMETVDNRRFDEHLEAHIEADAARIAAGTRLGVGPLLLMGIAAALTVGMMGYSVIAGEIGPASALTLAGAVALMTYPIDCWGRMDRLRKRAARASVAVAGFLNRRPELLQVPDAKFLPPLAERIVLENVSVEGPTGRSLLEGISLEIPAGSKTALMGRDEDSKQALVCLLPRLLDPKSGRVRMDGRDLREVTLDSLRAQVATVFQSDLTFSDTASGNIGLGDPSFDLPRIIEAAKNTHAHHVIQDLPQGYDTFLGPLGHYLRVDEHYRIALARAWLHDPSILIIEEPIAAFEDGIKPLIDDAIARLSRGRTVIFLAHRLSTIRSCDRVIVLHNGRIEASGSSRELQAENKLFRHLQYVEFNQFAAGGIEAGQM